MENGTGTYHLCHSLIVRCTKKGLPNNGNRAQKAQQTKQNTHNMDMTLEITLRLFIALLLGGIIGIEREYRSKEAGFRTHFLVALGSALFYIVSQYGFGIDTKDSSRVAAQVVSGIGFLGAGTIIFQKNVVRGLTTAAGLEVINSFIPTVGTTTVQLTFTATTKESVKRVVDQIKDDCIELYSYELRDRRTSQGEIFEASIEIKVKRGNHNERLIDYMDEFDDVTISSIE